METRCIQCKVPAHVHDTTYAIDVCARLAPLALLLLRIYRDSAVKASIVARSSGLGESRRAMNTHPHIPILGPRVEALGYITSGFTST
jgi:hypothetical protein